MFSCNDTSAYCCRGLAITMVVSLLFILLLRYIAGLIVWLVIIGVVSAVGYGKCPQTSSPCQWLHLMRVLQIHSALVIDLSYHVLLCFSLRYLALLLGVHYSEQEAKR